MSRSDSLRQVEAPLPSIGGTGLSRIPAPESGWMFMHVPTEGVSVVTVVSQCCWFWVHWARIGAGRAVAACRCQFDARGECPMCDLGHERKIRYVVAVETEQGDRLLELGRVQYDSLAAIEAMSGLLGARVRLGRVGRGKTSAITVVGFGFDPTANRRAHDIAAWVSSQGQREFLQWRRDRAEGERRQVSADRELDAGALRIG